LITGFMPKASNRDGVPGGAGHISSRLVAEGDRRFLRVCQVLFYDFLKKLSA